MRLFALDIKRLALAGAAVALVGLVQPAYGLGLGRMAVASALGQPLRAEVELTAVAAEDEATLSVRVAPESAFREARLDFNPALANLRFDVERRGASVFVKITSLSPISEPYLDLILEASWANGRTRREYTLLLDPPALRDVPPSLPPVAAVPPAAVAAPPSAPPAAAPAATPAPVPSEPPARAPEPVAAAPKPAAEARAPVAAQAEAPRASAAVGAVEVKPGDTLGRIARETQPASVSLDQMLVALVRTNPDAFINGNMNLVLAGKRLSIPTADTVAAIAPAQARAEVVAQSRDFAEYRSRLSRTVAAAPAAAPPASATQGQVTPRVEDKGAAAKSGDRLTIAKAEAGAAPAAAAAAKADEEAARQRAVKEQQERAAELQKTNEALRKALELQSKSGAQAQAKAEAPPAGKAAPVAPAATESKAEPKLDAPAKAEAKAEAPAQPEAKAPAASPPPAEAVAPAPGPSAAPAPAAKAEAPPAKKTPPPPPPAEPGFIESMLGDTTTQLGVGALVLLVLGWAGYSAWRRRRVEQRPEFQATVSAATTGASSLFRTSGGRSVDTSSTSTFNSSFVPGASQFDTNEVDPVAEADVYIAYGREEQAEQILKEALRLQPERHAARLKLLEIYSRNGNEAAFSTVLDELRRQTGGSGEDWERAMQIARAMNPTSADGAPTMPAVAPRAATSAGGSPTAEIAAAYAQFAPAAAQALAAQSDGERAAAPTAERRAPGQTLSTAVPAATGPSTKFEATFGLASGSSTASGATDPWKVLTKPVDFSSLDFDLQAPPTKTGAGPTTRGSAPTAPAASAGTVAVAAAPSIPDVDLNLSPRAAPVAAPATTAPDDAVARTTIFGRRGGAGSAQGPAGESTAPPLIDFDLGGATTTGKGPTTSTKAGSPLSAQMATKLDLAKGYIELGVRDGARELLEEVARDGTAEQRASAVELLRTVEG